MSDVDVPPSMPLGNQERNKQRQEALFRSSSPVREVETAPARKRPRFLGDDASDDEGARPSTNTLDDLFAGIDDLPDDRPRIELTSRISAQQREQMLAGGAIDAPLETTGNIDEAIDGGKKQRAPRPKIDADRLLGPRGFPALIEAAKKFKVGPKGSERDDLKRMMAMYQLWAHQMFPKSNFGDSVDKIEKLCKSRVMGSALQSWRVEYKQGKAASVLNAQGRRDGSDDEQPVAKLAPPRPLIEADGDFDDAELEAMIDADQNDAIPNAQKRPREDDFDEFDMDMDELDRLIDMGQDRAASQSQSMVPTAAPTAVVLPGQMSEAAIEPTPGVIASVQQDDLFDGIDFDDMVDGPESTEKRAQTNAEGDYDEFEYVNEQQ